MYVNIRIIKVAGVACMARVGSDMPCSIDRVHPQTRPSSIQKNALANIQIKLQPEP